MGSTYQHVLGGTLSWKHLTGVVGTVPREDVQVCPHISLTTAGSRRHACTIHAWCTRCDLPERALGGVRHFMLVEATMWSRNSATSGMVVLIATCTSSQLVLCHETMLHASNLIAMCALSSKPCQHFATGCKALTSMNISYKRVSYLVFPLKLSPHGPELHIWAGGR